MSGILYKSFYCFTSNALRYVCYPSLTDSFDVVRHKKNNVKIVDFGAMDEQSTSRMLFTYEELQNHSGDTPEFRFIGEEMGVCPKPSMHYCVPEDIGEFLQSKDNVELLDTIRRVCFRSKRIHACEI